MDTRYVVWHRSRGYGGPDRWSPVVSYNNRPLLFRTEEEAEAYTDQALDRRYYDFATTRVVLVPPPE